MLSSKFSAEFSESQKKFFPALEIIGFLVIYIGNEIEKSQQGSSDST